MSSLFPGSGLGSPLDVRMRRESRRSRALLTTRSAALARQEVTPVKESAVAPPRPALVEGAQACSEDLAAWLAAAYLQLFTEALGQNNYSQNYSA